MFISMLVNVFDESRAVDSGGAPLEFEGSEKIKEDRKRDKQSITTSTPGFEKISTCVGMRFKKKYWCP